jgi:hypothetical protein
LSLDTSTGTISGTPTAINATCHIHCNCKQLWWKCNRNCHHHSD